MSLLIVALGLFVGVSIYISPAKMLPGIDFSSEPVNMLADMWSARQIAVAMVIAFSLVSRSSSNLKVVLQVYCLVTFQDIFIGIKNNDGAMAAISAFFCLVAATMIYSLRKQAIYK